MLGYLRARDRRKAENRTTPCRQWQLVADRGRDDSGRRRQVFRPFKGTEAQARVALRRLLSDLESGRISAIQSPIVADWIDKWIAHKAAQKRKRRTLKSYADLLRLHVTPRIGNLKLSDLTTLRLQRLFDELQATGRLTKTRLGESLSPATVRRVHQALSAAMTFAVKMGLLPQNCAEHVELPRTERRRHRVLSQTEAEALLSAARGTYLFLFILIGFCIGLRRGEIFGLRWSDIDWNTGILTVDRQIADGGFVEPPKNESSHRTIQMPGVLIRELKILDSEQKCTKALLGAEYVDQGYIFATELGDALSPGGMYTLYRAIFSRAGVIYMRPHDLRHSAASLLIASGVPIPEVAEILGHASSAVTMAIYAHAVSKTSSRAADEIQARFEPA